MSAQRRTNVVLCRPLRSNRLELAGWLSTDQFLFFSRAFAFWSGVWEFGGLRASIYLYEDGPVGVLGSGATRLGW